MKKPGFPKLCKRLLIVLAAVISAGAGLGTGFALWHTQTPPPSEALPPLYNQRVSVSMAQRSFYPNDAALIEKLDKIYYGQTAGLLDAETLQSELEQAVRMMQQLGYYYDYAGKTAVMADGVRFGAADPQIGGGEGYVGVAEGSQTIFIFNETEFYLACEKAQPGDVLWINPRALIDISDMRITHFPEFSIAPGVTIASNRGVEGAAGGGLKMSFRQMELLFASDGLRLSGLVLEGAGSGKDSLSGEENSLGAVITGQNVEIDNCEISGFFTAGIVINGGENAHIHHNYIHNIQGPGNGYGIWAQRGSARIEGNLFSNVNTAVFVSGEGDVALTLTENVETGTSGGFFAISSDAAGEISAILRQNTVLGPTAPAEIAAPCKQLVIGQNFFGVSALPKGAIAADFAPEANLFGMDNPKVTALAKEDTQ